MNPQLLLRYPTTNTTRASNPLDVMSDMLDVTGVGKWIAWDIPANHRSDNV